MNTSSGGITPSTIFTSETIQEILMYIFYVVIAVGLVVSGLMLSGKWSDMLNPKLDQTLAIQRRSAAVAGFTDYGRVYEGFATDPNKDVTEDENYLVNYAFLTASIGGFLGPVTDGFFSQADFLQKAMSMGVRGFVLPIGQHFDDNKLPPNWPAAGEPGVFARDNQGAIVSQNGMTVKSFCQALLTANAGAGKYSKEPLLLFLHEQEGHVPDKNKEEEKYVSFLSKLAAELGSSLDRVNNDGTFTESGVRMTRIPAYGSAVQGIRQTELLTEVPMKDLGGKVLIFSNFEWSRELKDAYKKNKGPRLGDYINFTYAPGKETSCTSIKLEETATEQINWRDRTFTKFNLTLKDSLIDVPDIEKVQAALSKGVQIIPLPIIFLDGADKQKVNQIVALWQSKGGLAKPKAARFKKPAAIQPAVPSQRLNARVNPSLQPGQTQISA